MSLCGSNQLDTTLKVVKIIFVILLNYLFINIARNLFKLEICLRNAKTLVLSPSEDDKSLVLYENTPENYPDSGLVANYCRNPDGEPAAWCYTMDSGIRFELCGIPQCTAGKMFLFFSCLLVR